MAFIYSGRLLLPIHRMKLSFSEIEHIRRIFKLCPAKSVTYQDKVECSDGLMPLFLNDDSKSLLSVVPDISQTPRTQTKHLDDLKNLTDRIISKESRINDIGKLEDLCRLRGRVFTPCSDQLSWDLNQWVEMKGAELGYLLGINDIGVDMDTWEGPLSDYVCEANSFVSPKPHEDNSETFTQNYWIEKLNKIISDDNGLSENLFMQFCGPKNGKYALHTKYVPFYLSSRNNETSIALKDTVGVVQRPVASRLNQRAQQW